MQKISSKNIAEALYEATKGKNGVELEQILKRSVSILNKKNLLGKSENILHALQSIIDKKTNTIRLKVTTAKNLQNEERKKLEQEIKQKYKASVVMSEFFVKEELLGGVRVEVEDEVLDTTYKNKLQQLEKFLISK